MEGKIPHEIISKLDNKKVPQPLKYQGKLQKNNKNRTLLSKSDWKKSETKKWVNVMKVSEKYDFTSHAVKAWVLQDWLRKTFANVTLKEVKKLLYECETDDENSSDIEQEPNVPETEDSDTGDAWADTHDESNADLEKDDESPDMFDYSSE